MTILHRYILRQFISVLALCCSVFTLLFLVFDFFDRIDNIFPEKPSVLLVVQYFLYKTPLFFSQTLPMAVLAATLLSLGLLAKNSELTAMRACGAKISWLTRPIWISGIVLSLIALLFNETIVPYSTRRVKEIYNIDIRKKDKRGGYSQNDFWWRSGERFFSIGQFDSRTESLLDVSIFTINNDFQIIKRLDAAETLWQDPIARWKMKNIEEYSIDNTNREIDKKTNRVLPLPISEEPKDFYAVETEPLSMNFAQMKAFIDKQSKNGLNVSSYLSDLYDKIAFPFICFVVAIIVIPFALKPARTQGLAGSVLAGILIGFTYYAVHSFSLAMGRAEIWHPLLAAWMANIVMISVALVLNLGAEAPN
jgi:lipopolysaccharide export system permease protein